MYASLSKMMLLLYSSQEVSKCGKVQMCDFNRVKQSVYCQWYVARWRPKKGTGFTCYPL